MPEFVRVVNTGETNFDFYHNNTKKRIPPGKEFAMPWALATSLFGDPFLRDQPKKPDRTDALRRARGNFNFELGMETMEHFHSRLPKFEVYDMETVQRIHMLIEDPEGELIGMFQPADIEADDKVGLLQRQVEMLMGQLSTLIQQSNQQVEMPTGNTATASTDAPEDIDPRPRVEHIGGNPFATPAEVRGEAVEQLFDFAALSESTEPPPSAVFDKATEDAPQEVGVGSQGDQPAAAPRIAPRKGK